MANGTANPTFIWSEFAQIDYQITANSLGNIPLERLLNEVSLRGGKHLRPFLCFTFGKAFGCPVEPLITLCRTVEWVHSASLIHDDVIDEAKIRRNRKTLREETSNAHAIIGGDHLIAKVIQELSGLGCMPLLESLAVCLEQLSQGEWLQLEARGVIDVSKEHLINVAHLKTGSLMSWACLAPLLYTKQPENIKKRVTQFALHLGVAFQILDDIKDFSTESQKDYAKDLKEGLINFVSQAVLSRHPRTRSLWELAVREYSPHVLVPLENEILEAIHMLRSEAQARLSLAINELNQLNSSSCFPEYVGFLQSKVSSDELLNFQVSSMSMEVASEH